ncbi:hypothetical protein DRQ09_03195 [candidate division KSB1 bacterium]|nr:MAG: hypothetical protein DRQ09_03195 [candidate division KSB1 bacterium]
MNKNKKDIGEIIVVDNCSSDSTPEILKSFKNIKIFTGISFSSDAEAFNFGISKTSSKYIVLLKPYLNISQNWINRFKKLLNKEFSLVGPLLLKGYCSQNVFSYVDVCNGDISVSQLNSILRKKYNRKAEEVKLLKTDCLCFKRSILRNGKLLDENLTCGVEELELSYRMRKNGLKLGVALDVLAVNEGNEKIHKKDFNKNILNLFNKINKNKSKDFILSSIELWEEKIWEYDNLIYKSPDMTVILPYFDRDGNFYDDLNILKKVVNLSDIEIVVIGKKKNLRKIEKSNIKFFELTSPYPFAKNINEILLQCSGRYIFINLSGPAVVLPFLKNAVNVITDSNDENCVVNMDGSIIFPRKFLNIAGGFDERFESVEFSIKDYLNLAKKAGFSVHNIFLDTSTVYAKFLVEDKNKVVLRDEDKYNKKWGIKNEVQNTGLTVEKKKVKEENIQELLENGNSYVSSERFDDAIECYRQILKINPLQVEALNNLGYVLFLKGKRKEGIETLNRAIRIDPLQPRPYFSLGMIYFSEKDYSTSVKYFRKAISRDINFEQAYEYYLLSAEKCGIKVKEDDVDFVFYTGGIKFDGNTIYEKGLGGSESALFYMAREIARKGFKVKVFNNCDEPGVYENVEYGELVDYHIFNKFNRAKVFISSRSFKPFFYKINADIKIIWLHDTFDVAYLRDYDFSKLDFSDIYFFTLSKFHTEEWKKNLNISEDRFFITRNGFDPDNFKQKRITRNKNKILYTSRPIRGLEILLKVFPEIRREVPEAELHLFTYSLSEKDNEVAPYLDLMKQPGIKLRVDISKKELAKELLEGRVLAYPSIFRETSCISAIEAQAAGLPVVTTNLAALPETVKNGVSGIIIDGDARTEDYQRRFVKEVVRLLKDDRLWDKLSKGGRKRAYKMYTWPKIADRWIEKINEIGNGILKKDDDKKVSLSLCMIVKNEEENLPVCLDSVKDIVDEIIIVDTGSTDGTKRVAEKYGAKIFDFEWCNDFSRARNFSISKASGDWILYLDADEKVEKEDCKKILDIIKNKDLMAVNLYEYIPQQKGNIFKSVASDYCRLFRNHPDVKFEGAVHEQILPSIKRIGGKVIKSNIKIIHWGFAISEEKKIKRNKRNLMLLLEEEKFNPYYPFVHHNLGKTYQALKKNKDAIDEYNLVIKFKISTIKDDLIEEVYTNLAQLYFADEDYNMAFESAQKSLLINPDNIFAMYIISGIYFYQEKYKKAKELLQDIIIKSDNSSMKKYIIDKAQVYVDLGNCCYRLNDFNKALNFYMMAINEKGEDYIIDYNIGNCFVKLGKIEDAVDWFSKSLSFNSDFESAKRNLVLCENLLKKRNNINGEK